MASNVLPLFGTPLYSTYIDISRVPDFNAVNWIQDNTRDYSETNQLLNEQQWAHVKSQILSHVNTYFHSVISADDAVNIDITISWMNKSVPGQTHTRHNHPNSVLSGVLFFDFHESGLTLIDSRYRQLRWQSKEFNILNSQTWTVKPEPGLLLIWPSEIDHEVETLPANSKTRYSLAFNTWITGVVNPRHNMNLVI